MKMWKITLKTGERMGMPAELNYFFTKANIKANDIWALFYIWIINKKKLEKSYTTYDERIKATHLQYIALSLVAQIQ